MSPVPIILDPALYEVLDLPPGTIGQVDERAGANTVRIQFPDSPSSLDVPYEWFSQPATYMDELRNAVAEFRSAANLGDRRKE